MKLITEERAKELLKIIKFVVDQAQFCFFFALAWRSLVCEIVLPTKSTVILTSCYVNISKLGKIHARIF